MLLIKSAYKIKNTSKKTSFKLTYISVYMIRIILNLLLSLLFLIINTPVFSYDVSQKSLNEYILKISRKFSKTYCNSIKFGISKESALKFSIGETNKEFLNNKLNKFIDNQLLNNNILLDLENNCQIYKLSIDQLDNLTFK